MPWRAAKAIWGDDWSLISKSIEFDMRGQGGRPRQYGGMAVVLDFKIIRIRYWGPRQVAKVIWGNDWSWISKSIEFDMGGQGGLPRQYGGWKTGPGFQNI